MAEETQAPTPRLTWRFPRTFWFANAAELCERAAYYGMFITLYRYLNNVIGFGDQATGAITACFAGGLYFLPTFMGILADRIGFKQALLIAFSLLTAGYALLGMFQLKTTALAALLLIMVGGAAMKPTISGTVAKCSDAAHRARAMSIFYMIINIGSFSGKCLAGVLNERLGLQYIDFYAAAMTAVALLLVALFYRNMDAAGTDKTLAQAWRGLVTVMSNVRFLSLILIVAGFWIIQGQLYGALPTYIERMLGQGYKPEWLANINPLVVVIMVVPVTHLVRRLRAASAIGIALLIVPLTALLAALGMILTGTLGRELDLRWFHIHPFILTIIVGIALQGLAECFLSPKFYEYASKQAPPGEIGLYMGYQSLANAIAWLTGLLAAGFLLDRYCPDPRTLPEAVRVRWQAALAGAGPMPEAYAHAHYLWYVFAAIGAAALLALLVFRHVTGTMDRRVVSSESQVAR
jgi:dipeptide/tripeptide permease